jgi:signal transduction histidine kinase
MSESLQRGRRAVRRIVVPGLVIVCIVVLGSAGLLSYTAHSVDRVQVREERALVVRKIARALDGVVNDITSASVWDQAYENLGPDLDLHWADIELGHYYSKYFGHALSVVLDPHDTPVYAWRGEQRVEPASTTAFVRAAGPLVVRLRAQERRAGERAGPAPVGFPAVTTASGVVEAEGGLYIVGASTIVRETTEVELRPGPGSIVLSAKRIDPAFLASFENDLGVSNAAIKPPGAQSDAVSAAVIDINGRAVADLVWTPSRSGLAVLRAAIPVFLTGLLVLALAGLALAARIRAILADLAANDATLDEAMAELVRARDQAQSANIAKSQFLANMSHEIRTPLNGVLGMAHVMSRDTLEPAQRARLDVIQHSGETLLTILNDVLDISKIEAGKLELDNHEFVLDEALQAACDTFASLAAQKKVGFRVVVADEAHGLWFGDSVRLRQVLMNLVSNAVKFTARGEVEVRVERTDKGLWFQVRDSGIGIPEERMADLFQKFSQVDATTTRKFGGTGLGLAICHELVALMGGRTGGWRARAAAHPRRRGQPDQSADPAVLAGAAGRDPDRCGQRPGGDAGLRAGPLRPRADGHPDA